MIDEGQFDVALRRPSVADACSLRRIVIESRILESNTLYAYLLLCRDFAETCVIAENEQDVVGFVLAYRPPQRVDVLFVWQIAVVERARQRGLAKQMLNHLISRTHPLGVQFLEATVTADNKASRNMFESFARSIGVTSQFQVGFRREDFGTEPHEPEDLFRAGPFTSIKGEQHSDRQRHVNQATPVAKYDG